MNTLRAAPGGSLGSAAYTSPGVEVTIEAFFYQAGATSAYVQGPVVVGTTLRSAHALELSHMFFLPATILAERYLYLPSAVFLAVPLGLAGGVFTLMLTGIAFSVSAALLMSLRPSRSHCTATRNQ